VEGCMSLGSDEPLRRLLEKWGSSIMSEENDTTVKLLHLDPEEAARQQQDLRSLRRRLDAQSRHAKAEEYKALANAQFGKEAWRIALVGYLAGTWMLRQDTDDPLCPLFLANHLSALEDVPAALGPPHRAAEGSEALRASLLLNFAAAAQKLSEWRMARSACERVLSIDPLHPKGLWRLAKAYEGDSNLSDALATASKLASSDPGNKEASKLLASLQARKAKYGKMFGSIVERAHAEGDTLYTMREHERDVSDAMQRGFVQCFSKPMDGKDEPLEIEAVEPNENGECRETVGELMEKQARAIAMAREPVTAEVAKMNRVVGKAFQQTKAMREEGVKQQLPPNVLASYVDP